MREGEPSPSDKEEQPSRRRFLGLTGAAVLTGSAAYLGYRELEKKSVREREAFIDSRIAPVSEFIRGPEGKRILENGSTEELWDLIGKLPALLPEHIKDTQHDVPLSEWPAVVIPDSPTLSPRLFDTAEVKKNRPRQYGNGFFLDTGSLVTNWHVYGSNVSMPGPENRRLNELYRENALDIVHVELPKSLQRPNVKPLRGSETNDSIHGSLVVVAGIDPDTTAPAGVKLYPSMAVQVTPALAELFTSRPKDSVRGAHARALLTKSFLLLLPPGATASPDGLQPAPDSGMSGAPVMKSGSLAGIYRSSMNGVVVRKGVQYSIGFFHGPEEIKKAREAGHVYKVPEQN
jgi:hypothetical protein